MRVLYMVERFWPYIGGVEVATARVLPALAARGHEFTVVTSRDDPRLPEQDEFCGIPVRRLALMAALRAHDPDLLVSVREQVATLRREADLTHVIFTGPTIYYAPTTGGPILLSFHGSWPFKAKGFLAKALDAAAWVTACSVSALADLQVMSPSVATRSSAILNGLDPPPLAPSPLPHDPPVLLCAGRIVHEKGYDVALEAFAGVLDAHPAARLVIAGDGPDRSSLERRAAELGVSGSVEFVGWVSPQGIPALINRATIAVVPSRCEGFGLVALEAALMARPVVASKVGGLPEIVVDQETGLLVAAADVPALAAAMLRLLDDPEEARRMGEAGRDRGVRDFSAGRHTDAYESLYERLAAGGRTVAA